jgi:hypothetical protein
MLLMSKINAAEGENKQKTRVWVLPFLLMIALGLVNISPATAQPTECNVFIGLSARLDHCCWIESADNGRFRTGSENQTPCTCRSQYDEQLRSAVSPDSLRWHPDNGSLFLQQGTLSAETQTVMPTFGLFPANPTPIYTLFARFLI